MSLVFFFYDCQRMLEATLTNITPYKQFLLENANFFWMSIEVTAL